MLPYNRKTLLADTSFVTSHRDSVNKYHTQQVIMLGLLDLNPKVSDHPVVNTIERGAMRDSFNQGVRAAFDYFMRFADEDVSDEEIQYPFMDEDDLTPLTTFDKPETTEN